MKYLKIKNNGLIEVKALTLVGASTKSSDESKIGQFGSGNKYALAYLLRNNYGIKIYSGLKEIKISTKKTEYRGNNFHVIVVNGRNTSITTEMGRDWELWQSLREIYCNSIDEGGHEIEGVDGIQAVRGETHFYIEYNSEIDEFMQNFDSYFSHNKKVLFECSEGQILERTGENVNIYRKGIKCTNYNRKSIFDYNMFNIRIDENRLVKYDWDVEEKIWDLLFRCDNVGVIKKILMGTGKDCYESSLSGIGKISAKNISNEFKETVQSLKFAPKSMGGLLKEDEREQFNIIPNAIFDELKPILKNDNLGDKFKMYVDGFYREIEPNKLQNGVINNALDFLKENGFYIPYIVKVGVFADKQIQGLADRDLIVLSEVNLEKGVTEVINTIIEEYIHIKYGVADETRGFQTALIGEFISYMKNK